jgi:hypothetical protein
MTGWSWLRPICGMGVSPRDEFKSTIIGDGVKLFYTIKTILIEKETLLEANFTLTLNQRVVVSNPSASTISFNDLRVTGCPSCGIIQCPASTRDKSSSAVAVIA